MSGQTVGQMSGQLHIGIRYCGGCNPGYDRVRAAQDLKERFPQIVFDTSCQEVDAVCVLCGCSSACAETGDIKAAKIWICCREDLQKATEQIELLFYERRKMNKWNGGNIISHT